MQLPYRLSFGSWLITSGENFLSLIVRMLMVKKRLSKGENRKIVGKCCFFNGESPAFVLWSYPMTAAFATCDFCDLHKNDSSGAFRVLPPVFRDFGKVLKFYGVVQTVKCFEDNTVVKAAVDSQGWIDTAQGRVGKVLVVDAGASLRRALLGGNLGAAAARNGWAGVLIDGCVRDTAELAGHAVGIRALAAMPLPTEKRGEGQSDVAVQVQGVWIRPGDWLYADEDGIVISTTPL